MDTPKESSSSPRILSVSRDAVLLASRNAVLRQAGYTVFATMKNEEAIALAQDESIDAVVLGDSILSAERDELARAIHEVSARIPIVLLKCPGERPPAEATACMDSLDGPEVLLGKLREVLGTSDAQAA
jgi:response regulator RpfG family c-di-GMP phosphodiesterase